MSAQLPRLRLSDSCCAAPHVQVPSRLLMGPGPTNAWPRVLAAQSLPLLGHMHPPFMTIMNEIQAGLRYVFQVRQEKDHAGAAALRCRPSGTNSARVLI